MKFILLLCMLLTTSAFAQNSVSKDEEKIAANFKADNNLRTGLKIDTLMDFTTGMAGANFGLYSIARGRGNQGSWGVHDIVGVHGTAVKDGVMWAAGGHFDVYDTVPGGTALGVNIEFPQTQRGTNSIGLNMQPHSSARGLVGIQIQNPESFKAAVDMPNMNWIFGDTDGATFGMRYDEIAQSLRFYRNIGQKHELMVHEIKMDFGKVK